MLKKCMVIALLLSAILLTQCGIEKILGSLEKSPTVPPVENSVILEIYEDGSGNALLDTLHVPLESKFTVSILNENPYFNPPRYFIYAKRVGYFTKLFHVENEDTILINLDPVVTGKFCGVLFMDNGFFADNVTAKTYVVYWSSSYNGAFITDEQGRFAINAAYGNYEFTFQYYYCSSINNYSVKILINGSYKDISVVNEIQWDKPNIYIYPVEEIDLDVTFLFPNGGSIVESIPEYNNGWHIHVKPGGIINNLYEYLFYESTTPDLCQYHSGWVIAMEKLEKFFRNTMVQSGFNQKETADFIEYWIPRLNTYPYYAIYPQYQTEINNMVQLQFSKQPDSMLRVMYAVRGLENGNVTIGTPEIPVFERKGFSVVEWGVILK